MNNAGVPRRTALKLVSAVVAYSLSTVMSRASSGEARLALAQSAANQPAPASDLTQAVWLWQRTHHTGDRTEECSDPTKYTITFIAAGQYSLQADCNQGSGTYAVAGPRLTIQPGPMTQAACGPGSQDSDFLQDLSQVATYAFDGENLVLNLQMDSGDMVFSPQPPVSLTGAPWQVTAVNNGHGGLASVVAETQLDATFGENGSVTGSTGCNRYRGLYASTDNAIAFGPIVSTRRACLSADAATQEQAFIAALGASTKYDLKGNRLTLRDDGGAAQVDMVRSTG